MRPLNLRTSSSPRWGRFHGLALCLTVATGSTFAGCGGPSTLPASPDIEETTVAPPIETGPIAAAKLDYAFAPPPPYPNDARRRRIEGTVYLQVLVDVDGRPLDVLVQRSSGNRSLDDAARKQVLNRWRFRPATRDGVPVQAVGIVPVKFSMQ